jgi:Colicin V production protein
MNSLSLQHSPLNWFDLVVVITLLLGMRQGRKNGMSVELTPMMQWMCIVALGALLYRPLGDLLADSCPMEHVFCYITVYILVAIAVKCMFSGLKKMAGGKLAGSDIFGRGEFYLGMVGGAVRFLCILLAALALLNAPYYSAADIASNKAYQVDMYGSTFFPGLSAVQTQIFRESLLGSLLKDNAGFVLIASTKSEKKDLPRKKDDY